MSPDHDGITDVVVKATDVARTFGSGPIAVVAVHGEIDISRTLDPCFCFIQLIAHRSHVPQFVEYFSHGRMDRPINTFLNGKSLF